MRQTSRYQCLGKEVNQEFSNKIYTTVWQRAAKANWMPFCEARAYMHTLKLQSQAIWNKYKKNKLIPFDIPTNPSETYKSEWKGWGDFLGTGRIATQ